MMISLTPMDTIFTKLAKVYLWDIKRTSFDFGGGNHILKVQKRFS